MGAERWQAVTVCSLRTGVSSVPGTSDWCDDNVRSAQARVTGRHEPVCPHVIGRICLYHASLSHCVCACVVFCFCFLVGFFFLYLFVYYLFIYLFIILWWILFSLFLCVFVCLIFVACLDSGCDWHNCMALEGN